VAAAFADCGTPAAYLAANLAWSGGRSVVGEGAEVAGTIDESVVWPGESVAPAERLHRAIRYGDGRTVLVRP
jgi:MurNAc alpha-1-phosphate uridylyltransferase